MEGHVSAGWGSQRGWGGGARGKSGLPGALQDFTLCWRSFSQALYTPAVFLPLLHGCGDKTRAVCAAWPGADRHCLSSGGSSSRPIPSRPILTRPVPAQQRGPQDPALPGPRRAALSLLQWQQAPSHEEARGDGCGSQERSAS